MPGVTCPRCGLYNPEPAERCDCGYDFASGEVKTSYLSTVPAPRSSRLKRKSILLMLLLIIFTGGFYFPAWFLLRRDGINNLNAEEKLTTFPFVVVIVLIAVSFGFSLGADNPVAARAEAYEALGGFTDVFAGILLLVQCFKVRRILEAHLDKGLADRFSDMPNLRHSQSSLSGVAVFFLQIFYLQYVINGRLAPAA